MSRNILKKFHTRYSEYLLPFLEEVGYLKRSGYKYSSVYGICYYYQICGDLFIERMAAMPKPLVTPKPKSKAEIRAERIRAYKKEHPEATVRAIASLFECSIGLVSTYLRC